MIKAKHIKFTWVPDPNSGNPTCERTIGKGFSAFVLIPYDAQNDPASGVGTWNGVAQNRGQTGFASKADAIAYCELTIRDFAQSCVNAASNFLDVDAIRAAQSNHQGEI